MIMSVSKTRERKVGQALFGWKEYKKIRKQASWILSKIKVNL